MTARGCTAKRKFGANGVPRDLVVRTWRRLQRGTPLEVFIRWSVSTGYRTDVGELPGKPGNAESVGWFTRAIDLDELHEEIAFAALEIEL